MTRTMNALGRAATAADHERQDRPMRRYWGDIEPPKNKIEFFNAVASPTADGDATVATIRMYGPIDSYGGWWGISTEDVARVLDALPASVEQIVLRINSPGGEMWEAMAILNMFGAHRASVIAVVDGLAASAASFIAAGCERTVMSPGSQMMIHSPSSITWGNASEMRKTADFLDKLEESIVEVYTDKAGEKDWATLLAEETWLSAADTVALGLADSIEVVPDAGISTTVGDASEEGDDLIFVISDEPEDAARIQAAAASARASAPKPPSSSEPGTPNRKETVVTNDAPQAGVERLGATDAAASQETAPAVVGEVSTPTANTPTNTPGIVAIDATVLAELQENARLGAEARAEQTRARRDGIIATALEEGRITPASRDHFRALLDSDEDGTVTVLNSLAANRIPVKEIGKSDNSPTNSNDLAAKAGWVKTEKGA